jgi:hypothetical protein
MRIAVATRGNEFFIDYELGSVVMTVDGVSVSTELFRQMIVSPREDRWMRFWRDGDLVNVEVKPLEEA